MVEWIKNKVLYEVNLRQYSQNGTLKEFAEHLPRLKSLGVDILWFMPIQPIGKKNRKGDLGSYYSVRNYKEIDSQYGTLQEFKELVKKIHEMGMFVILDWVANHTAWDHHWTSEHPDFYSKDENGNFKPPFPEWEDVIHLNYDNKDLWQEMIDRMKFWITETDIDGFRCDMAHLVRTSFWEEARKQLNSFNSGGFKSPAIKACKEIFMLAESENKDLVNFAFDALYGWNFYHFLNDVAQQKVNLSGLNQIIENEFTKFPEEALQMLFTSNHDENTWNGSAIERLTFALEVCNVLIFTLPGIPLIYSGQEAGNYKRLSFFNKDEIEWKVDKMTPFYSVLTDLKHRNSALWNGEFGGNLKRITTSRDDSILAFLRQKNEDSVLVICNLSPEKQSFYLTGNFENTMLRNVFSYRKTEIAAGDYFELEAWQYLVFEKSLSV